MFDTFHILKIPGQCSLLALLFMPLRRMCPILFLHIWVFIRLLICCLPRCFQLQLVGYIGSADDVGGRALLGGSRGFTRAPWEHCAYAEGLVLVCRWWTCGVSPSFLLCGVFGVVPEGSRCCRLS